MNDSPAESRLTDRQIAQVFDGYRLRQARQLALRTKQSLADSLGVSATAVGQFESGATPPRPDLIVRMATELGVPRQFFAAGRPMARLETADTYFRSLRSTTAKQRAKAVSYAEQVWELVNAIERHVRFPPVALPGFVGGEIEPGAFPEDPNAAARALRKAWGLGSGPVAHVVRIIENHGIAVVFAPLADAEVRRIDAFSTVALSRPIIVLAPDRADDVLRHRFTAAHELGHLVLHADQVGGDPQLEREADRFAAEFLTPGLVIRDRLPRRVDFQRWSQLSDEWGVSIKSLIYRSREVGLLSDSTARRAYIMLNQLQNEGAFAPQPVGQFPGETPCLLREAVELADANGVTVASLAQELAWPAATVRKLLGEADERPALRLVPT